MRVHTHTCRRLVSLHIMQSTGENSTAADLVGSRAPCCTTEGLVQLLRIS